MLATISSESVFHACLYSCTVTAPVTEITETRMMSDCYTHFYKCPFL